MLYVQVALGKATKVVQPNSRTRALVAAGECYAAQLLDLRAALEGTPSDVSRLEVVLKGVCSAVEGRRAGHDGEAKWPQPDIEAAKSKLKEWNQMRCLEDFR